MNEQRTRQFSLSFDAINRICEEAAKNDPSLAALNPNCPSLRSGRTMSDSQLLAKLDGLGIRVDRAVLIAGAKHHTSAEALSKTLEQEAGTHLPDTQNADWAWIATAVLWERWAPDEPSFEILSARIALGYESQGKGDSAAAVDVWLRAWQDVIALARKLNTNDMTTFDEAFGGYQCVFNWCQDLSDALSDAGRKDAVYLRKGIAYSESLLATFRGIDSLLVQNARRSIAEAHFLIGEPERGNALFLAWLDDDPRWGWGWIGWSDCLAWPYFRVEDRSEAERILREGLAVPGVRDRDDILSRLRDMRADQESATPATPLPAADVWSSGDPPRQRIGRNEPCPCGSGRKYKKCCLAF